MLIVLEGSIATVLGKKKPKQCISLHQWQYKVCMIGDVFGSSAT